jgi:hypothetical protein
VLGCTGSKGLGWELGVSSGTGLRECETDLNNC